MRTSHILGAIAISGGLVTAGIMIPPALAQNAPSGENVGAGKWLSIPQIHDRVVAEGYQDITEIEREDGGYEVKAIGRDGRTVKLIVDGTSGDIVRTSRKRASRDGRRGDYADDDYARTRSADRDRDGADDRRSDRDVEPDARRDGRSGRDTGRDPD